MTAAVRTQHPARAHGAGPHVEVADGANPPPVAHRAHLDGLRAVAVYLVVAFHAGADRLSGGFIGVDVFFVLSGYLVTGVLLRDLRAGGRIRYGRFYARRFRRLLPASFATLVVTGLVFSAIASPADVSEAVRSIRASFAYVANWFFIRESSDYFADDITSSPVVHFWSLAIEEQFYAFWPLILGGLYWATRRAGRRQWHVIRGVITVAAAASLVAALWIARSDLDRAYYGTDTRAYQLLAGALLALTPQLLTAARRHRAISRGAAVVGMGGLLLLATSIVDTTAVKRGVVVAIGTCVLLAAIEAADGGVVQRALSLPPVVYLGQISYGTYLWHWPVIVVAGQLVEISPLSLFALTVLVATGLAALSFQVLERPVRESRALDRLRWPVAITGLAVSLVGAFVVTPTFLDGGTRSTVAAATEPTSGATPVPADFDWRAAYEDRPSSPSCVGEAPTACTMVHGDGPHLLLMGDSHARMLVPAFVEMAEARGASFSVAIENSCPWQEDLYFLVAGDYERCQEAKPDSIDRVIPALDPDVIVLVGQAADDPVHQLGFTTPDGRLRPATPERDAGFRRATERTVGDLRAEGRALVLVEPIPLAARDRNPLECLSEADFLDECRYVASPGPLPSERVYRELDRRHDDVWAFDADRLACPYLPICDPMVDGVAVKHDSGHLTASYAATLSDEIDAYLTENGILPPPG